MKNHYHSLGILESASHNDIKSAFKRLALKWHPDKNLNSTLAEERFKEINEAYQILSVLEKKTLYDSRLSYERYTRRYSTFYDNSNSVKTKNRAAQRGRFTYSDLQHKKKELKNTLIAFIIMGTLGAITFGITGAFSYYEYRIENEALNKYGQITRRAQEFYNQGKFGLALASIDSVPTGYRYKLNYHFFQDQVLKELRARAVRNFKSNNFLNASDDYSWLRRYSRFFESESKRNLAICFKEVGDYKNASSMLEELVVLNPFSVRLCLDIADMNRIELNDLDKAIEYYEKGSDMAIRYYKGIYGKAFYILVQPSRTPQIHFDLFYHKAIAYYEKGNYLQARYAINWACFLRPEIGEAATFRGLVYQALGEPSKACEYWQTAIDLGQEEANEFHREYCGV